MSLYIGVNYHPHDWAEERWVKDIELMKQAGFTTVRLGHLCWDSYEPDDGVYTFEWFDKVMDLFMEAGIGVLLDVSMRPAPRWVHRLCPGCDIYGKSGTRQESLRRYMEDVADPAYQHYALRFARKLVNRYKDHPALFAFGLCNEIGDGYISNSEYARRRFVEWLKKKYGTVNSLNEAWASRRWSRKLNSFEDVVLQENEIAIGAPEAWLDMRRFFSDGIGEFMVKLKMTVEECAPGTFNSSNHYAEKENLGFDYLKYCEQFVDYPGMGFYPGYGVGDKYQFISSVYMQRLAETGKPMWCLEFQTGSKGVISGPPGVLYMHAMLCLLNRMEMILGWTWRSMLGGEEQYLYGLLGHDGVPTANYYEYKRIAEDMKKLQDYSFPYLPKPDVAVAYNYDSMWVNQYSAAQYQQSYRKNMIEVHKVFYEQNRDYNIVDLRDLKNTYKLLIIPGHIVMESNIANNVREYVRKGGTVVMTGYSAGVDETGKVFSIPKPGLLSDVFGIRAAGFYRTDMEWTFSQDAVTRSTDDSISEVLQVVKENSNEQKVELVSTYYEDLELREAAAYAMFKGKDMCAVSVNQYGKGKAYYMAAECDSKLLSWLLDNLTDELGLKNGLIVPEGIQARAIEPNQSFYVNTTNQPIRIMLDKRAKGILKNIAYDYEIILDAYECELVIS